MHVDDPTLVGDVLLYRRIPPLAGSVEWNESGEAIFSSMNFKDRSNELSFYIANETTPEQALAGHEGFGLVSITAGEIRNACERQVILIRRDEIDPAHGHIIVCGNITSGPAKRISKLAKWVPGYYPRRPTQETQFEL